MVCIFTFSPDFRQEVREKRAELIQDMDCREICDRLPLAIISREDKEEIDALPGHVAKNRQLLDIIVRKGARTLVKRCFTSMMKSNSELRKPASGRAAKHGPFRFLALVRYSIKMCCQCIT